jgi:hypothetical protein
MGLQESTSIRLIKPFFYWILIDVLLFGIIILIEKLEVNIIDILSNLNHFLGIGIEYQWYSSEPSNVNLYLFAGQIAFVVLTGTAISFISGHMTIKYFGFEIREILMYDFSWFEFNIGELALLNFLLLFSAIPAIYLSNSELVLIILFFITLVISMKVFYMILCVYFSQGYLLNKSEKIIIHELNLFDKNRVKDKDYFEVDYEHVEGILKRILKHSEESIISGNLNMFKENIKLVTSLSTKNNILAIQNIGNSILFGSFYQDVGEMLSNYNKLTEMRMLLCDDQIIKNCNPKCVNINDPKVADMFCAHYCEAVISNIRKYTQMINENSDNPEALIFCELHFINFIYKKIYYASRNFENGTYANIQKTNWSSYWVRLSESDVGKNGRENLVDLLQILLTSIIEDDVQWNIEIVKLILEKNPDLKLKLKNFILRKIENNPNKLIIDLGISV